MIRNIQDEWDGFSDPYDVGYLHGEEDVSDDNEFKYRPGIYLEDADFEQYRTGYYDGYNQSDMEYDNDDDGNE